MAAAKKRSKGDWIDSIFNGVGRFANLETADGVRRSGRISGLRTKMIQFNGESQEVVLEIELNGDPSDCVPVGGLASLTIQ